MLDMVFNKADPRISAEYDARLVPQELQHFGQTLRDELKDSMGLLLELLEQKEVMESDPKGKESMHIRAGYLQPLHFLQIELFEPYPGERRGLSNPGARHDGGNSRDCCGYAQYG